MAPSRSPSAAAARPSTGVICALVGEGALDHQLGDRHAVLFLPAPGAVEDQVVGAPLRRPSTSSGPTAAPDSAPIASWSPRSAIPRAAGSGARALLHALADLGGAGEDQVVGDRVDEPALGAEPLGHRVRPVALADQDDPPPGAVAVARDDQLSGLLEKALAVVVEPLRVLVAPGGGRPGAPRRVAVRSLALTPVEARDLELPAVELLDLGRAPTRGPAPARARPRRRRPASRRRASRTSGAR